MLTTTIIASVSPGIWIGAGGIAAVLLLSAVFYAIGRGEDRDRAQAERAVATDEPGETPRAPAASSSRPPVPPQGARGRRRR